MQEYSGVGNREFCWEEREVRDGTRCPSYRHEALFLPSTLALKVEGKVGSKCFAVQQPRCGTHRWLSVPHRVSAPSAEGEAVRG